MLSLATMIVLIQLEIEGKKDLPYGTLTLLMVGIIIACMLVFLYYSEKGFKQIGPKSELDMALFLNPTGPLFLNKEYQERMRKEQDAKAAEDKNCDDKIKT